jgi:hypothetical protein
MLGTHRGLGKGADIQPPYRARYPPAEVVGREGGRGRLQTLQVNPRLHLRKRQPPLCQRKHSPAMDGGNHPCDGEPPSRNFCKASKRGWSFSCFSRVAPQRQLLPAAVTTR